MAVLDPDTFSGGDPADRRMQRLADESLSILAAVDAQDRAFTQDEDDRIKAISDEVRQLMKQGPVRPARPAAGCSRTRATPTSSGSAASSPPGARRRCATRGPRPSSMPPTIRSAPSRSVCPSPAACRCPPCSSPASSPRAGPARWSPACAPAPTSPTACSPTGARDPGTTRPPPSPRARPSRSPLALVQVTDQARTIAHLAHAYRQDLADSVGLAEFITQELLLGVAWELDDQIVSGAGTVDNPSTDLVGILNTPGTLVQLFTDDLYDDPQGRHLPPGPPVLPDRLGHLAQRRRSPRSAGRHHRPAPGRRTVLLRSRHPVVPTRVVSPSVPDGTAIVGDGTTPCSPYGRPPGSSGVTPAPISKRTP